MQLYVVVEHIVTGELVQLSQHAKAIVRLGYFDHGGANVIILITEWKRWFYNLDIVKPVGEDFQHCVQSSPGLLLENLKCQLWIQERLN